MISRLWEQAAGTVLDVVRFMALSLAGGSFVAMLCQHYRKGHVTLLGCVACSAVTMSWLRLFICVLLCVMSITSAQYACSCTAAGCSWGYIPELQGGCSSQA